MLLRAKFLVDAKGLNKVRGQPFTISEVVRGAQAILAGEVTNGEIRWKARDVKAGQSEVAGG